MCPQERLASTQAQQRPSFDGVCRWLSFVIIAVTFDPDTAPANVLDNLHEVDSFTEMKCLHRTVDLISLELGCFMHHHSPRRAAGMTPAVQVERARHDAEHLGAREERV